VVGTLKHREKVSLRRGEKKAVKRRFKSNEQQKGDPGQMGKSYSLIIKMEKKRGRFQEGREKKAKPQKDVFIAGCCTGGAEKCSRVPEVHFPQGKKRGKTD